MRLYDAMAFTPIRTFDHEHLIDLPATRPPASFQRVIADDVSAMYWTSEQEIWNYRTDFGPIRPPFPYMWIEARMPHHSYAEGLWRETGSPLTGWLIQEVSADEEKVVFDIQSFSWFPKRPHEIEKAARFDQCISAIPILFRFTVSPLGEFMSTDYLGSRQFMKKIGVTDPASLEALNCHVPMLALSLMNCRNVELVDDEPPEKLSKKHKAKHGRPLSSFSRITIAPTIRNAKTADEAKASLGGVQPFHIVRGHFKTYTSEKPLFGSRTGTYWWGWQARGKKSAGERLHDYEIGRRSA